MTETYDGIVLGVGGFGSGAFDHLARRGLRVVGIERFGIAHDRGSSHGETRIIRKAYFEHPDYVPLLLRAYDQWHDLEESVEQVLLHDVGLLIVGPPEGEAVAGARLARTMHGVPLEDVNRSEVAARFPAFRIPEGSDAVYEPDAGYLKVEACVRAHIERGCQAGGVLRTGEVVQSWSSDGKTVTVQTDRTTYHAGFLVITAGAWSTEVLGDLRLPLDVCRKPQFWFDANPGSRSFAMGAPTFYFERSKAVFYGFPSLDGQTMKVAEHSGGNSISNPLYLDRSPRRYEVHGVAEFVRTCLPAATESLRRHAVCMYTLTPDRHFIVDRHPQWPNVAIGAGFSGHGFKFTTVLGEALADLATQGRTDLPIGFLSATRDALRRT